MGEGRMRVIRTEMYFDGSYISRSPGRKALKTSSITFAWIKESGARRIGELTHTQSVSADDVPVVLDYILRQEPPEWNLPAQENVLNGSTIDTVMNEGFVIEESPVDLETLTNLLKSGAKGGATVALSVYVAVSGDVMLFITLPSALLVMGAAKGMSKWLEQNVPKMMTKLTRRWT
jgi:hypothetical protein